MCRGTAVPRKTDIGTNLLQWQKEKLLERTMDWSLMRECVESFHVMARVPSDKRDGTLVMEGRPNASLIDWSRSVCDNYERIKMAQRDHARTHDLILVTSVHKPEFMASVFMAAVNVLADRRTGLEPAHVPMVMYLLSPAAGLHRKREVPRRKD